MRKLIATLLVVAAPAALAAGCGGNGTSKPVATHEVLLPKSYRFEPSAVAIEAGTSVTWPPRSHTRCSCRSAARRYTAGP